jgi:type I restriction-modification system DNA methylase subunit
MGAPKFSETKRKTTSNDEGESQLRLLQETNPFWQSTLFSDVYLRNDVPTKYRDLWENDHATLFYEFCEQFRTLCEDIRGEELEAWTERTTINRFIKPVLKMLGWAEKCTANQEPWIEDESLTIKEHGETKIYKPDFIIVDSPKHLKYIESKDGDAKIVEARNSSLITIEAKYWGRIDESKFSKKENKERSDKKTQIDSTKTLDFDEQCLKYVDILHHDYGILTDGRTWRLYHRELSSGSFKRCYQFNLGKLVKHVLAGMHRNSDDYKVYTDTAKYFFHIFSKPALYSEDGSRRFVDDLVAYSRKYADTIEDNLKVRFVSSMSIACNGFKRSLGRNFTPSQCDLIRSVAESHIFNILFIRYCESRNILPIRQNPEYRKMSLSNVIEKLDFFDPDKEIDDLNTPVLKRRFREQFEYTPNGTDLYDSLIKLVELLQTGISNPKATFSINGFKESVFSKSELSFSKSYSLNNREMVKLLFELAYIEGEKQGVYQQIAYSYFAPRQLGSIYESFLEFRLELAESDLVFANNQWKEADIKSEKVRRSKLPTAAKGTLFFSPNNKDRKSTGSYYTPDYIVQYIVQSCLDSKVKSLSSKGVLKLRICDPAMGSGHFLAGALDYLAKNYILKLDEESHEDIAVTIVEAKRLVLHNCIYGIDINSRAVKLAKMSLWLETAASNQQLEDLDDQLIVADSLSEQFELTKAFPSGFGNTPGFDAVIGNPPYIARKNVIDDRFQDISGQGDLYLEFLHLSATKLTLPGGMFSMIVPDPLLVRKNGLSFRKMVRNSDSIALVTCIHISDVFTDANVSNVIVVCSKSSKKVTGKTIFARITQKDERIYFEKTIEIPKQCIAGQFDVCSDFPQNNDLPWTYLLPDCKYHKLTSGCDGKLSDICVDSRGEEISKKVIAASGKIKILRGGESIKPHKIDYKNSGYIPELKKDKELYSAPKVVLQKSSPNFIAAVDTEGVAVPQSIYILRVKPNAPFDEWFIAGFLNSQLLNDYLLRKVTGYKLMMPHFEQGDLKELPFPKPDFTKKQFFECRKKMEKVANNSTPKNETLLELCATLSIFAQRMHSGKIDDESALDKWVAAIAVKGIKVNAAA